MQLSTAENRLLEEICTKNHTNAEHIVTLLEIEKDFANRNMMRRNGLKGKMREHINEWVKEA